MRFHRVKESHNRASHARYVVVFFLVLQQLRYGRCRCGCCRCRVDGVMTQTNVEYKSKVMSVGYWICYMQNSQNFSVGYWYCHRLTKVWGFSAELSQSSQKSSVGYFQRVNTAVIGLWVPYRTHPWRPVLKRVQNVPNISYTCERIDRSNEKRLNVQTKIHIFFSCATYFLTIQQSVPVVPVCVMHVCMASVFILCAPSLVLLLLYATAV